MKEHSIPESILINKYMTLISNQALTCDLTEQLFWPVLLFEAAQRYLTSKTKHKK